MTKISQAASTLMYCYQKFLAKDIENNPVHVQSFNQALIDRARNLTSNIGVDLDAPLEEKDESPLAKGNVFIINECKSMVYVWINEVKYFNWMNFSRSLTNG